MNRLRAGGGAGLLLALSVLAAGSTANAATITLNTAGTQRVLDVFQGQVIDIVTTAAICQGSGATTSVGAGVAIGSPCSGTLPTPLGEPGSFTGVAAARGSFGADGLQLGVQSSLDVHRDYGTGGGRGYVYNAELTSTASFVDTITLFGGEVGTAGFLRLAFDVDGSTALGPVGGETRAIATTSLTVNGIALGLANTTLQYDVPIVFGQELLLNVDMRAFVFASMMQPPDTFAHADFLNTASLSLAQVLDASGNLLDAGQIASTSGLQYQSGAPPATVPEPASLALMAVGLAIGAARRRRVA